MGRSMLHWLLTGACSSCHVFMRVQRTVAYGHESATQLNRTTPDKARKSKRTARLNQLVLDHVFLHRRADKASRGQLQDVVHCLYLALFHLFSQGRALCRDAHASVLWVEVHGEHAAEGELSKKQRVRQVVVDVPARNKQRIEGSRVGEVTQTQKMQQRTCLLACLNKLTKNLSVPCLLSCQPAAGPAPNPFMLCRA